MLPSSTWSEAKVSARTMISNHRCRFPTTSWTKTSATLRKKRCPAMMQRQLGAVPYWIEAPAVVRRWWHHYFVPERSAIECVFDYDRVLLGCLPAACEYHRHRHRVRKWAAAVVVAAAPVEQKRAVTVLLIVAQRMSWTKLSRLWALALARRSRRGPCLHIRRCDPASALQYSMILPLPDHTSVAVVEAVVELHALHEEKQVVV